MGQIQTKIDARLFVSELCKQMNKNIPEVTTDERIRNALIIQPMSTQSLFERFKDMLETEESM